MKNWNLKSLRRLFIKRCKKFGVELEFDKLCYEYYEKDFTGCKNILKKVLNNKKNS